MVSLFLFYPVILKKQTHHVSLTISILEYRKSAMSAMSAMITNVTKYFVYIIFFIPLDKVYALCKRKINNFILSFALVLLPLHGNLKIMAKAQSKKSAKNRFFSCVF